MKELKVYQLQELCNKWGIQTTGSKQDLKDRLETFCRGEPSAQEELRHEVHQAG